MFFKQIELCTVEYKNTYAEGLHGVLAQKNLDLMLKLVDKFIMVKEDRMVGGIYSIANHYHLAALLNGQLLHLKG